MKQRSGFVSNSSSSSFIVFEDLSSRGIPCLKLNDEQMKRIDGFQYFEDYPVIHFEGRQGYLTKFITGYYDSENEILESVEKHQVRIARFAAQARGIGGRHIRHDV